MQSIGNTLKIIWKGFLVFAAAMFAVILFAYLQNNYNSKKTAPLTAEKSSSNVVQKETSKNNQEFILKTTQDEMEKTRTYGNLDCKNYQDNALAGSMFEMINNDRKSKGLEPYSWNEKLCESAMLKVKDMTINRYFQHVSPDSTNYSHWIEEIGYDYSLVGENLAMNATTAKIAHTGLMNSPGHYENLMSRDFSEIGIAYGWGEIDGQEAFFIVQHFGNPLSDAEKEPRIICVDKEEALSNISNMEQQKLKIEGYLKEANDTYEKLEEDDPRIEEVEDYINTMESKKADLEKYIKENQDYLSQCEED